MSKINTSVALVKGWVNSFLAFLGQVYFGFYSSIKLMDHTAYSILELGLHANTRLVSLVTTGRLDVVLHEAPPERIRHTIGRPRVVGQRLASLEQIFQDPETVWQ